jgi:hypothetical protein
MFQLLTLHTRTKWGWISAWANWVSYCFYYYLLYILLVSSMLENGLVPMFQVFLSGYIFAFLFFVALRKPHFVFVKTQKYIYLQKTWNIGTFFIINNLAWNKLGTTLHIFGTNLEQNMEQLNS